MKVKVKVKLILYWELRAHPRMSASNGELIIEPIRIITRTGTRIAKRVIGYKTVTNRVPASTRFVTVCNRLPVLYIRVPVRVMTHIGSIISSPFEALILGSALNSQHHLRPMSMFYY